MDTVEIKPVFKKDYVAVVLHSSNYYTPYTGITISSLLENISLDVNYDINITSLDMSEPNIYALQKLVRGRKNVSLRVHNVSEYYANYNFFTRIRFGLENWARVIQPFLFKGYDKLADLDCDICVDADVAELYATELGDNYIAAAKDINVPGSYARGEIFKEYIDNVLEMQNPHNYFQTGVTVMNLRKIREDFEPEFLLEKAQEKEFRFIEQDLFNMLCEKKSVTLDMKWNYQIDTYNALPWLCKEGHPDFYNSIIEAGKAPKIIHYAGHVKPWNSVFMQFADKYWDYASRTPFYEILISRCTEEYNKAAEELLESRGIKI